MDKKPKTNKKTPSNKADNTATKTAGTKPSVAVSNKGTSRHQIDFSVENGTKAGKITDKQVLNAKNKANRPSENHRGQNPKLQEPKQGKSSPKTLHGKLPINKQTPQSARKTARKRKTQQRIITVVLTTILLAICIFISLKVLFIVREVQVGGSERYTQQEILDYCAIPLEENIFSIDIDTISSSLVENFTYIETAVVKRRLPDKIQITITDSLPTYYQQVGTEDGALTYTVFSQNFKKLTTQAQKPENLLCIAADLADEATVDTLNQLIEIKAKLDFSDITKIEIITTSNIQMLYQDRITIQLGTMLDMEYKLKMAKHVLANEIETEVHGALDCTKAGSAVIKPNS